MTRLAAAAWIAAPVGTDPVNEIMSVSRESTSAAPATSPTPCTTLKTPGGMPASTVRSASSEQASGDHSAGLRTTVQPAASAGAVFHVDSMNGAFQGVITAAGPDGIRWTRFQVPRECQSRSS